MSDIIEKDLETLTATLKEFESKIKGKAFLISGGSGFLGSWVCDVLNAFNAKIICVDNLSSGSKKNIDHLIGRSNFNFVETDICNFSLDEDVDYIVHMASIASPPVYQKHPIEALDANLVGTRRMLELAKDKKVKGFLFTSTSEVYGVVPDDKIPTSENFYGITNSFGPRCMYDEGKRGAEAYCYSYFKIFNLPIRIARIFNTYGPRLDTSSFSYGRVIVRFINQALANDPITIYGTGMQTRSFCYITDQIEGLFRLLLTPNLDGEVINIGNENEIPILDLAKKVIQITGSKSNLSYHPLPMDDPLRRCPDLTKMRKLLSFRSKITVDNGLKKTLEWCKENV